jgi:hypothetical protein
MKQSNRLAPSCRKTHNPKLTIDTKNMFTETLDRMAGWLEITPKAGSPSTNEQLHNALHPIALTMTRSHLKAISIFRFGIDAAPCATTKACCGRSKA